VRRFHIYLFYTLLLLSIGGCQNPFNKEQVKWEVSLQKEDKAPYGSYIAYQSLRDYFPDAKIEPLSSGFRFTSMDGYMHFDENGKSLLVLLGLDFNISTEELDELINFADNGNEVMLFCSNMDNTIANKLRCQKHATGREHLKLNLTNNGKENKEILTLKASGNQQKYGYEGRALQSYFTTEITDSTNSVEQYMPHEEDSTSEDEEYQITISAPDTLGYAAAKPNFISYEIGTGHITLHAAPLVLSNYFLLQDDNKNYLDGIWHTLPTGISHIYWNEYYKRRAEASSFSVLWRYPATRWALIIALFTLLMYVLFESKRRQKIIPIIERTENASLSFTETVGRLYYNKGNHTNIAEKMIQHFLEWVRNRYYLNTNHLNNDFVQHLSKKTGQPIETVSRLVEMIHEIRTGNIQPDEPYLYELYTTIQQFYKNNEQ
jgi:hypothetical protein